MIYRVRRYVAVPEQLEAFHDFFNERLLPIQVRHGARLVGRWETDDHEVIAVWEYADMAAYERVAAAVRADPDSAAAQRHRETLGPLYTEAHETFARATVAGSLGLDGNMADAEPDKSQLPASLTGGCNCGAVRFAVTTPLVAAHYCHCHRCQRRTGTAASVNARAAPSALRVLAGEDRLRAWKPKDGREKWFCVDCGSALFSSNTSFTDPIGIRMGAFDEPWHPSQRQVLRRLRGPLGADPRRRSAALRREAAPAMRPSCARYDVCLLLHCRKHALPLETERGQRVVRRVSACGAEGRAAFEARVPPSSIAAKLARIEEHCLIATSSLRARDWI